MQSYNIILLTYRYKCYILLLWYFVCMCQIYLNPQDFLIFGNEHATHSFRSVDLFTYLLICVFFVIFLVICYAVGKSMVDGLIARSVDATSKPFNNNSHSVRI